MKGFVIPPPPRNRQAGLLAEDSSPTPSGHGEFGVARKQYPPPLSTNTNSWPLARRHFDGCGVRRMRLWFRNAKYFCLGVRNRNEMRNLEHGSVNLKTREKKYFYRSARTQRQNRGTRARGTRKLSGSRAHLCSYPDSTLTNHYKMSCYI